MEVNNNKKVESGSLLPTSSSIFLTSQKPYINSIFSQYDANQDGIISLEDGTTDNPFLIGKDIGEFGKQYIPKEEIAGNRVIEDSIITDPKTWDFVSQSSIQRDKTTGQVIQTKTTIPSELSNFSNYQIKNAKGEVTDSVNFSQDENGQHEKINITTSDGGKFIKNVTNNGNKKSVQCTISNKNGEILYKLSKEYERDDKTASVNIL